MEPKIITKNEFMIIGLELRTTHREGIHYKALPEFWAKIQQQNLLAHIPNRINDTTYLGICSDFDEGGSNGGGDFTYTIGIEVSSLDIIPHGMVGRVIPSATYAVFTASGIFPDAVRETWKYIYETWHPGSGLEGTGGTEFELYDERCTARRNQEMDIYFPIKGVAS